MEILLLAVLLVRVGLAMYTAGLTRAKNSSGVVVRAVCDLGVAAIAFYLLGAAIVSQGHNRVFALSFAHWFSDERGAYAVVLLFLLYTTVATGIVQGPMGERSRFAVALPLTAVLAGLAIPLLGFWVGRGWLGAMRFIDVAGGCWVHAAGGAAALVAAWRVGPRQNKYHRDGSASIIPGHSVPLAALGAMLTAAGLTGIVAAAGAGAAGPLAGLNAVLAGAAGTIASLGLG